MGFSTFDEVRPLVSVVSGDSTNTPGELYVLSSQPYSARIDTLAGSNSDVIDHVVTFGFDMGGGFVHLCGVNIPAGSGFGGVPSIDCLAAMLPGTNGGLVVPPGTNIIGYVEVIIGVTYTVVLSAIGGTF